MRKADTKVVNDTVILIIINNIYIKLILYMYYCRTPRKRFLSAFRISALPYIRGGER